jgi:ATP-dependent Zn protease
MRPPEPAQSEPVETWLAARRVEITPTDPSSFVGIGHALTACQAILGRLRHPELAAAAGIETPRGVLLYGPPGTGKTLTARWLAGELGPLAAYDLPIEDIDPPRLRAAFTHLASQPRSVVFLPEIDAVGLDRRSSESDSRRVLFALLEALDGLRPVAAGGGPLVIATTNRSPSALDPALVRAGRLGLHVGFRLPNEAERLQLFRLLAGPRPGVGPRPIAAGIDWERCAALTERWTPADIRAALDDAFGLALLRDGPAALISDDDLRIVIARARDIDPDDAAPSQADLERTAVHEAGHVAAARSLGLAVRSVRLALHGREGRTEVGDPELVTTDAEVLDLVVVALAGSAAEAAVLGSSSHGSRDDVQHATRLLMQRMEAGTDGAVAPTSRSAWGEWVPRFVDEAMSRRVLELLDAARDQAEWIVSVERVGIETFTAVLREHQILAGQELESALRAAGWGSDPRPVGDELPLSLRPLGVSSRSGAWPSAAGNRS